MKMKKTTPWTALALLCASVLPVLSANAATPSCTNCFEKRWIYFGGNITAAASTADANFNKLIELIHLAKAEGFNGIALSAGGSGSYVAMLNPAATPTNFYPNFALVVQAAKENGIALIPVGGGPEVPVSAAPDLIEALPVIDTPFIVQDRRAVPVGQSMISDPSFENENPAWDLFEKLEGNVVYDLEAHTGSRSIKFSKASAKDTARLFRQLNNLQPHTAYRVSFWIKTENYHADAAFRIKITEPSNQAPMYSNASAGLGWGTTNGNWNASGNMLATTQGWTQYNLDFNTGNNTISYLYMGSWNVNMMPAGKVWLDDIEIKQIGLAHTIRRTPASLPVTVKSADGSITYVESVDYVVGKESLSLPPQSTIGEGALLRVSAYQSAQNMTSMWGTPASACHQKFFDIQKQYYDNIHNLFEGPQKFFLYYDENRVLNWDPACGNITAGKYLADMIKKHQETLLQAYPNLELYVWNDMFDPKMNAIPKYWAANGDLTESWKGLKPSTTVVNWTGGSEKEYTKTLALKKTSLEFFHALGHQQMIAGYYDDNSVELDALKSWLDALTAAEANGVNSVNGFMYTTWNGVNGYGNVKKVADFIKSKQPRRWPQQ
ncbi:Carbohydrate binding domain-containing protein [Janthinobacterium lividum]|uniref:Carbohydrate binding domain-containing protein n=1 Tax=Janthinobacterium lividum TaxID=29581 RepID=A0AB38C9S4_9BURK|nr:carbohydrate binding domain-containing protein [Janthinobacterium lividum]SFX78001.1 Carbohydrate binding domain-containing protein [Janthinobacterium lividum]